MLGYIKANPKRNICFDPHHPTINERSFSAHDWYDFYRDSKNSTLEDAPTPRGNVVSTHCFVNAYHSGDRSNRRSQTGVLIFLNKDPILWYINQQNTVKTSTFLSEFISFNIATKLVEDLWYKLQMFSIPIEGPSNMFCDNESVYKNVSTPESTLKKNNVSICYHKCKEDVEDGLAQISKEGTSTNLSGLFTKILVQIRYETLLDKFTYLFICEVVFV